MNAYLKSIHTQYIYNSTYSAGKKNSKMWNVQVLPLEPKVSRKKKRVEL